MTFKKESDNRTNVSSGKTEKPVEVHEALRLKQYHDALKSDTLVEDLKKNIKPNDEAFKEFKTLIKTAKYRNHEK